MDFIVGLKVEETAGEPSLFGYSTKELKRWMIFFMPAIGGLLNGIIGYKFAP